MDLHIRARACVLLLATVAPLSVAAAESTFEYTVRTGDTCTTIAKEIYGDGRRSDLVHRHNRLGPPPHVLRPGQILVLPTVEPEANLTAAHGRVQARAPRDDDWKRAATGLALFRAWKVGTQDRSLAEITFTGGDQLRLRENTIVVIHGSADIRTRSATTAELASGALSARIGELSGRRPVAVRTPSSDAELGTGASLITVDPAGATRLANHGGKAARVASRRRTSRTVAVEVADGMGSKVEVGKDPTPPRPLPPTPSWLDDAEGMLTVTDGTGTLRAAWTPVDGAAAYRVEVSRDAAGLDVVSTVETSRDVTAFELVGVPLGEYHLVVASVDADRFESKPSPRRRFDLLAVTLTSPDGSRLIDVTVPAGTRVRSPDGFVCTVGDAAPAASSTVRQSGELVLRCQGSRGTALVPLALRVPSFVIRAGAPGTTAPRRLRAGVAAIVDIDVPPQLESTVQIVGDANLAVGAVTPVGPGRVRTTVTASLAGQATLRVLVPIEGEPSLELGTIEFTADGPVGASPRGSAPPPRWKIGLFGAHLRFTGDEAAATNRPGLVVGRRVGRRAGVQLEGTIGTDGGSTLAGVRLRGVASPLPAHAWWIVGLGAGAEAVWSETGGAVDPPTVGIADVSVGVRLRPAGAVSLGVDLIPGVTSDGRFSILSRAGVWLDF